MIPKEDIENKISAAQVNDPPRIGRAQVYPEDAASSATLETGNSEIKIAGDIADANHIPRKYIWRSCCLILDSRAVLFFSQLAISIIIMLFCIRQMATLSDVESQKNYAILLSFMVGLWFPAPKIGS